MDLNMILGAIGSIATLETRIREAISQFKENENGKRINRIDVEVKLNLLKGMDEYTEQRVDEYIARHASSFKSVNLSQVFSNDEKESYVNAFFDNNNDLIMYRDIISNILYEYIHQLENCISKQLTEGEKFIVKKMNQLSNQVSNVDAEIFKYTQKFDYLNSSLEEIKGKLPTSNVFKDSDYSESVISLLNMVFSIIEQNNGEKLLKKTLKPDALRAENFENVVFRFQKIINLIDKDRIEKVMRKKFDNGLQALHFYIQYIAADFANKLNPLFSEKIQLIMDCIYSFDDKDSRYYLALGALGLRSHHTEEHIYTCVIDNLRNYLSQLLKVLNEKWKSRNYEVLENAAVEEMKKMLWRQIKFTITERNRRWMLEIVSNDHITDIELAKRFNVSVKEVRKELYPATKIFLYHKYVDDYTTSLSIYEEYKEVIINNLSIGVLKDED